ncbi:MAG: hypothetical protein NXI16_01195 [Alphaproteobacteria bacterium]|nr:hypothetical protein [Alphaproteobacteria bacterium]
MGFLFDSEPQTVIQQNELPDFLKTFYEDQTQNIGNIQGIAANIYNDQKDYIPYSGARLQNFTTDQLTGMERLRNNLGITIDNDTGQVVATGDNAVGQDQLADAIDKVGYAGQTWQDLGGEYLQQGSVQTKDWTPGEADRYMNPYRDKVIDARLGRLDDVYARRRSADDARASEAGVFGGGRHAVLDALREEEENQMRDQIVAEGEDQGYQNSQQQFERDQSRAITTQTQNQNAGLQAFNANRDQFNTDMNRIATAGQGLAGLATTAQQMGNIDVENLMRIGGMGQDMGQKSLDIQYEDFLNQKSHPWQQMGALSGAISGNTPDPYARLFAQQQQTTSGGGPNMFSQIAGAGLAGLGVAGGLGWQPLA